MIPAEGSNAEVADDGVLFDTPLARLAIGSAGAVDRLITRTQGQVAIGVTLSRLVAAQAGLPVASPGCSVLDRPRLHPVRSMTRRPNVTPLRPSDRLSAVSPAEEPPDETLPPATETAPRSDELAVPSYDELAASQVVKRLPGLTADELAAIGSYEEANRGRRTILTRVRQLQSSR